MTEGGVRRAVTVPVPADRAFAVFTEEMSSWWPREYTWSEEDLDAVVVEPRQGGRWFERDRDGREWEDWGRVLTWHPPRRVVLTWQISPERTAETDPARASELEVRFEPEGESTRVELEHRAFDRHGRGAEAYRDGMDSPEGWTKIVERYVAAAT